MKSVITNAAEITVLQPIDNTYKTGGGPVSFGGCVIVASKGRPFAVQEVFGTDTSQEDIFVPPLPKKAYGMEGLRHLSEAAKECNWVQAVRVVNQKEYRYPSLGFIFYRDNVPGVHYSPAGEKRGYLARTGVAPLFPDQNLNRDTLYTARLNPVIDMTSGGACADDDLTQFPRESYLRFGWVNDVLDYIDQRFVEAARIAKFEPDGLTREILYDLLKTIMDELVTSGALVSPRSPTRTASSRISSPSPRSKSTSGTANGPCASPTRRGALPGNPASCGKEGT